MPTIAITMPIMMTALGDSPRAMPMTTGTMMPSEVTGATTPMVPCESA